MKKLSLFVTLGVMALMGALTPVNPISLTQNAIAKARSFTAYMFDPGVNSLL